MSEIKLTADSGGGTTSLKAPSSTTSNADVVLKLPVADGSANQVLKTDGSGQLSFTSNAGTTINNNADNRIITGSGTASTLEGESTLTYDGSTLLATSANFVLKGVDTNASNAENFIQFNAGYITYDSDASNSTGSSGHYFQVDGAEKLRIDSSGVTIKGATNAAARLLLQNTTSVRTNYIGLSGDDDRIVIAADDADQGSNSTIDFKVDGSERMRIDSSGNVGIGNDASFPVYTHVSSRNFMLGTGSESTALQLHSSSTTYGGIYFGDVADRTDANSYIGSIQYKHGDDYMDFRTNSAERMRIDSSGNVGINKTNPSDKFHVEGTTNFTGNSYIGGDLYMYGGSYTKGIFLGGSGSANKLDDYEEGTYTPADASGNGITYTSNSTARYVKIGMLVYVQFDVTLTNCNNLTTEDAKFNLPFTFGHNYGSGPVGWTSLGRPAQLHIASSGAALMDNSSAGNNSKHLINSELNNVRFIGSFHYITTT